MIEKILAGFIVTIGVYILIYFYNKRQLYTVIPKMYDFSFFSEKGTVFELKILNKGRNLEEEIILDIDTEKQLDLLSANSSTIVLNNNQISIPRLFPHSEASLILSNDKGKILSTDLISLTSKTTNGKIYDNLDEIPPANTSIVYSLVGILLSVVILYFNVPKKIEGLWVNYKTEKINKVENLFDKRWSNLSRYYSSDLKDSYSDEEFPISFISMKENGKVVRITYEIINKSALPIKVRIQDTRAIYTTESIKTNWHHSHDEKTVQPLSKDTITIEGLRTDKDTLSFEFHIEFGTDTIYNLIHTIPIEPFKTMSNQEMREKIVGTWKNDTFTKYYRNEVFKKDGKYEIFIWDSKLKNKLFQHTKGKWYIKKGFIHIKDTKNLLKNITYPERYPSEIINLSDNQLTQILPKKEFVIIKSKLSDNYKDLPEITDQKLTEKIVGDWKVDSRKLFYRVYSYKKDRTYEINFWLNKHKTVNILTAKGKWKIKNRLLLITIDKVESEHNQSVKVVFNPEIINITDSNLSYFTYKGLVYTDIKLNTKSKN